MIDGVQDLVLSTSARERLGTLVELIDPVPIDLASIDPSSVAHERLAEVEVLIGSWGCAQLDAAVLERVPALKMVAYAAGTVRPLVSDELWSREIAVSSAAQANAVPVAEFTFAAIVMAAKDVFRIRDRHRETRGQDWVQGIGPAGPVGTNGIRIGIVGASRIGRLVIERLATLDAQVGVADPFLTDEDAATLGVVPMAAEDLFGWANIVSLHAPALPSTDRMVDAALLAAMPDGTWLINTARGSLVDTAALEAECSTGRLCALIDTAEPEPFPAESPLYDLENVVLTPHIAGSLGNEISRMGDLAVDEVERWLQGQPLNHQVHSTDMETIA
jgi:phosphoglycerate dehydrogenase-like enzyme